MAPTMGTHNMTHFNTLITAKAVAKPNAACLPVAFSILELKPTYDGKYQ